MIVENIVTQMLKTNGYKLYFHEFMFQFEPEPKMKKYEIHFKIAKKDLSNLGEIIRI